MKLQFEINIYPNGLYNPKDNRLSKIYEQIVYSQRDRIYEKVNPIVKETTKEIIEEFKTMHEPIIKRIEE